MSRQQSQSDLNVKCWYSTSKMFHSM